MLYWQASSSMMLLAFFCASIGLVEEEATAIVFFAHVIKTCYKMENLLFTICGQQN
jgi:hypothetical protein